MTKRDHDSLCTAVVKNPVMLVPWYLMAAYAYYVLDRPIISDAMFDRLAQQLLSAWPEVGHRHKHLITEDDLRAGTLLIRDYPAIVVGAAESLLRTLSAPQKPHAFAWLLCP